MDKRSWPMLHFKGFTSLPKLNAIRLHKHSQTHKHVHTYRNFLKSLMCDQSKLFFFYQIIIATLIKSLFKIVNIITYNITYSHAYHRNFLAPHYNHWSTLWRCQQLLINARSICSVNWCMALTPVSVSIISFFSNCIISNYFFTGTVWDWVNISCTGWVGDSVRHGTRYSLSKYLNCK